MRLSRIAFIPAMAFTLAASLAQAAEPVVAPASAAPANSDEAAREALNRTQAEAAQQQVATTQQSYDDAIKARDAEIRRRQEAYEAEKARLAKEHEEAMARWEQVVAACKKGDRKLCPPPAK